MQKNEAGHSRLAVRRGPARRLAYLFGLSLLPVVLLLVNGTAIVIQGPI